MRNGCVLLTALILTSPGAQEIASAQTNREIGTSVKTSVAGMRVLKIRDNVYMVTGAGGNITVLTFDDGMVVVDTGSVQNADKVLAVLKELSDKPVTNIINTSADPDHVGGNEKLALSGRRFPRDIIPRNRSAADRDAGAEPPNILAHENVLARMSQRTPPVPTTALPDDVYHLPMKKLSSYLRGGEPIQLFYEPAAHTDGDTVVWFRRSDIIMTGEIFNITTYPVIDVAKGGTVNGLLKALNHVLDVAFPFSRTEGGTMIVPGKGRLCDTAEVGYYRDMVTIIRDRVQALMDKGMTLEQVKAAKPSMDYDGRYAAKMGPSSTDMFVEAIYKTLQPGRK